MVWKGSLRGSSSQFDGKWAAVDVHPEYPNNTTILPINEHVVLICILQYTIFAKDYGTCTLIFTQFERCSTPPPQFNVGPTKIWCLVARCQHWNGWGREGGINVSQNDIWFIWVHVKTKLSQCILSKILDCCTHVLHCEKRTMWWATTYRVGVKKRLVFTERSVA